MKKILFAIAILCAVSGSSRAADQVWKSSWTATADTGQTLCGANRRGLLHSIEVGTAAAGTITLLDSRGGTVAISTFGVLSSTAVMSSGPHEYNVVASSGITYTNSTAGTNMTIFYQCY